MLAKLDKKDREIIQELQIDARQGYSEIAKKVTLSKEVVRYRIKRLTDSNIIARYVSIINATKIGQESFRWYLQLENTTSGKLREIIDYFVKCPYCIWVSTCTGRWDLIIVFSVYSPRHFDELTSDFRKRFGHHIRESQFVLALDVYFKKTEMFGIPQAKVKTLVWGSDKMQVDLKPEDAYILYELSENPLVKVIDIAKKYHLSFETVKRHIANMLKSGLLQGTSIIVNYAALDLETYKIFFKIKSAQQEDETAFPSYLSSHPNVAEIIRCLGNWNLEINITVKNSTEYHQFMMDLKDKFSGIIESYSVTQVFDNYKYNLFPMGKELVDSFAKSRNR